MIELKNVKKRYGKFELNCSLKLERDQVVGLIGRNGAGKSTTFKSILGLINVDEGDILFEGTPVKKLDKKAKQNIGVVLSDSGFSGYITVKDVIPILASLYSEFDKQAFVERCNHFSVPLNKKIKEFSTGMKAKLKVLVAMSHNAKVLILDEPTAGLDVVAREEILDILRDYMAEGEHSMLISSHISSDLEGLCDDIYMIDDGKIILHEETGVLLDEYGVLKITEEQYETLDKECILSTKKENFGYRCLTNNKQFYMENYPGIAIEKGTIDEVITLMISANNAVKTA